MLIDSSHKRWFLITLALAAAAAGLYGWANGTTTGGLSGGSIVGVWFGLAGAALMVYAGLLSVLRRVPSAWWLGARKTWLRGHVWLGLLGGVFILLHSGFRWGGPLEVALWVVLLLTLATGVVGLLLQQFLPRLLTLRIAREAPYEQVPHLCEVMRKKADALVGTACADAKLEPAVREKLQEFYDHRVRPFLAEGYRPAAALANPLQAEAVFRAVRALPGLAAVEGPLAELEAFCEERRQLGEQERLHYLLHAWLLVHVPLSAALLVLGLAHALLSLYY